MRTAIFLLLVIPALCQDDKLSTELEMADLELQDDCENLSIGLKSAIIARNFTEWAEAQYAHGILLRTQSELLKSYDDIPYQLERNWTFLVNSGDNLLEENDWNYLINFNQNIEETVNDVTIPCANGIPGCTFTKSGYQTILEDSHDLEMLKDTWKAWQNQFEPFQEEFPKILKLAPKAAQLNGRENVKTYWEMLVLENAFERMENLWGEIAPLYGKLQNFAKTRLEGYYNVTDDVIPVYMLGSNFGYDWSPVADVILPHPQLHYDIENHIRRKTVEEIFKLAEKQAQLMSLGELGRDFWSNSVFNMTSCDDYVISFCVQERAEVLTCDKRTWGKYLDAHEAAIDVALRNRDYLSQSRIKLRQSVVDEAVIQLSAILAVENFDFGFKNMSNLTENQRMTKLLLVALRTLPKLPYYYLADKFRLDLLENSGNFSETWWKLRKEIQKVEGVNFESDFLFDKFITMNKPYVGRFLGAILQFQILDYYQSRMSNLGNVAAEIGADENFRALINERGEKDDSYSLSINLGIDEISSGPLLAFFKPLVEYFEKAPLEQEKITTTTLKPTTTTSRKKIVPKSNVEEIREITQSDQPKKTEKNKQSHGVSTIAMYIGIGLLIGVGIILIVGFVSKKIRKRRRTNNRRFET